MSEEIGEAVSTEGCRPETAPVAVSELPDPALHQLGVWPVVVIQDRYGGTYSRGLWLALQNADERRMRDVFDGPHGDDCDAMEFWMEPPAWIAVGPTPNEAIKALLAKGDVPDPPTCAGKDDWP